MAGDWHLDTSLVVILGILGLVIYLIGSFSLIYIAYYLLTLPLRRAERTRLFLDLIERGILNGQTPEMTMTQVAETRDPLIGRRWRTVAAAVRSGISLSNALKKTPNLLSSQLVSMLCIGEQTGNLKALLPAGRALLADALSQTRGAMNYVILITMAMSPALICIPVIMKTRVVPTMISVFTPDKSQLPPFTQLVFEHQTEILVLQSLAIGLLWLLLFVYAAGPRLKNLCGQKWPLFLDALVLRLPWRRKRLQRDFTSVLSILLDAGVPESEAVRLAGEATANQAFEALSRKVIRGLERGQSLPEAVQDLDDAGELRWRLTNAAYGKAGFQAALAGWHEHLDAKAFQLEQSAAQILSTTLVLYNGVLVGGLAAATFLGLINLINIGVLW